MNKTFALAAIALARLLLDECGLPRGQLNVVTGGGSAVGAAIVDHDEAPLASGWLPGCGSRPRRQ